MCRKCLENYEMPNKQEAGGKLPHTPCRSTEGHLTPVAGLLAGSSPACPSGGGRAAAKAAAGEGNAVTNPACWGYGAAPLIGADLTGL